MYKIEKDIPIGENSKKTYPWDKMNVGDSFKAPLKDRSAITGSAAHYAKKNRSTI